MAPLLGHRLIRLREVFIPPFPITLRRLRHCRRQRLRYSKQSGDELNFEVTSSYLPGLTRRFKSCSQAAHENSMSRFFGGIHSCAAVRDGELLGRGKDAT